MTLRMERRQVNIGFVGLGAMGALIVPRLMAAGHKVTGWNRSRDKAEPLIAAGMAFAATPRAVAAASDIVFSIVTDSAAVKAVALGPDGSRTPGGAITRMIRLFLSAVFRMMTVRPISVSYTHLTLPTNREV